MVAPKVITLGCRLNAFESEIMRQLGRNSGLDNAVIINTCAVTAEAERQARQMIRRARRDNPNAKVIVTGCAAQLSPERYGTMPEVDRVIGNSEKLDAATFETWLANDQKVRVTDIMTVRETAPHLVEGFESRARAFVQIQQGCDHRCTFCIIPFARGPNRSVGMGHLVDQVSKLVDQGFKEVVLTGVDICSYGDDLPGQPRLGDMVGKLLAAVPGLARLRLSSLDPAAMDDRLFDLIADEPRLMSHLHLSLQAMDDMVLKRMKRRHTREDGIAVVERIRQARPGTAIGADLIAGFPTETDEMFKNTLKAVKGLRLSHLHVFPYSVREGTPAAKMPGVSADVIKARAAVLRDTGHAELAKLCASQVGSIARVLIENAGEGHSEHYIPVSVKGAAEPGSIFDVRIEEFTETGLKGVTI